MPNLVTFYPAMVKPPNQVDLPPPPCQQPFYHIDIDEDDDNVKQLKQDKPNKGISIDHLLE
jgi:hypothetical protein